VHEFLLAVRLLRAGALRCPRTRVRRKRRLQLLDAEEQLLVATRFLQLGFEPSRETFEKRELLFAGESLNDREHPSVVDGIVQVVGLHGRERSVPSSTSTRQSCGCRRSCCVTPTRSRHRMPLKTTRSMGISGHPGRCGNRHSRQAPGNCPGDPGPARAPCA
jgi:hypothetical protein